jgi:hypothetical protein
MGLDIDFYYVLDKDTPHDDVFSRPTDSLTKEERELFSKYKRYAYYTTEDVYNFRKEFERLNENYDDYELYLVDYNHKKTVWHYKHIKKNKKIKLFSNKIKSIDKKEYINLNVAVIGYQRKNMKDNFYEDFICQDKKNKRTIIHKKEDFEKMKRYGLEKSYIFNWNFDENKTFVYLSY